MDWQERIPWDRSELIIHKNCASAVENIVTIASIKSAKNASSNRIIFKDKHSFKKSQDYNKQIKIELNPIVQIHPSPYFAKPRIDIPILITDFKDSDLSRTQELINRHYVVDTFSVTKVRPKPVAAVLREYEDPYSSVHAETKLLGIKGVNFMIISRSYYSSIKLAAKISLEMNSALIDPIRRIQKQYYSNKKGFFVPPFIMTKFNIYIERLVRKRKNELIIILESLVCSDRDSKVSEEGDDELLDIGALERSDQEENFNPCKCSPLSGVSSESIGCNPKDWYVPLFVESEQLKLQGVSPESTSTSIASLQPPELYLGHEEQSSIFKSDSCPLKKETLLKMTLSQLEELVQLYLNQSFKSFNLSDKEYVEYLKKSIYKEIAKKNFSDSFDWPGLIKDEAESFESYTKGYVLVHYPFGPKNILKYWLKALTCLNPPDVIVYGQCPNDEYRTFTDGLRINPFIGPDSYIMNYKVEINKFFNLYSNINEIEFSEVKSFIENKFMDGNVPLLEAMVLDYYELIRRVNILEELSGFKNSIKSAPYKSEGEEERMNFNEGFYPDIRSDGSIQFFLLEHYVKIPKNIRKYDNFFDFQNFVMDCKLNTYHNSSIVRIDIRSPTYYQFSIVKRWFDYSGLYAKPRPRQGDLARVSIKCELIGNVLEQEKLRCDFVNEFNDKMLKLYPKEPSIGGEEAEELFIPKIMNLGKFQDEQVEDEGYRPVLSDLFPPSESSSSLTEIDSVGRVLDDEFYYLKSDDEDTLSVMAFEKDLQLSEDYAFYKTYQCYFSTWRERCPVAHYEGKCRKGHLRYAVRLHDKVYFLSTEQAMKAFMKNPARYILPILPESQCSVIIMGEPKSAKTYVAESIATFFNASVINYNEIISKAKESYKRLYLSKASEEVFKLIEAVFSEDISSDTVKHINKCRKWLDKAYQLVLFRKFVFKPKFWDIYSPDTITGEELFSISEFHPPQNTPFNIKDLCRRARIQKVVEEIFLTTCEHFLNYLDIEPYFLKNQPQGIMDFDILFDVLLRHHFRKMGLFDIYSDYDSCNTYASNPYRLLERLPIDLLPDYDPISLEENIEAKRDSIEKFLFPLNNIPLSPREKIDFLASEIINLENRARCSGQLSYGGWIIDDMPVSIHLLKVLDSAGIFPRNVLFLDDPTSLYSDFTQHYAFKNILTTDIEQNLTCYMSPNLRNQVYPILSNYSTLKNQDNNLERPEETTLTIYDNFEFGSKVARVFTKFKLYKEINLLSDDVISLDGWPGSKGLRNPLLRSHLFSPLKEYAEYEQMSGFTLHNPLEFFDFIYKRHGRQFKTLSNISLINSLIGNFYRSFMYHSHKFKCRTKVTGRLFKLFDCFYNLLKEDKHSLMGLQFVKYKFAGEVSCYDSEDVVRNEQLKVSSYIYHLALAIESSQFLCSHFNNKLFEDIYTALKNLGFSINIKANWKPKCIEGCRKKEICKYRRPFGHSVNKCKFKYGILDVDTVIRKVFLRDEVTRKNFKSITNEMGDTIRMQGWLKENSDINDLSERNIDMLDKNLTINSFLSILECNVTDFICQNKDDYTYSLYFPKNALFLSNEEKVYDTTLITNKIYSNCLDAFHGSSCNNGTINLFKFVSSDLWREWSFTSHEINTYKTWFKPKSNNSMKLRSTYNQFFVNKNQSKDFKFLKNVCYIQKYIDILRENDLACMTPEEYLLLDYLKWIREEYFKNHFLYILGLPVTERKKAKSLNFPEWIPMFSEFCKQYGINREIGSKLLGNNKFNTFEEEAYSIKKELWPFRSYWRSLPEFMMLKDSLLYIEIGEIFAQRCKVKSFSKTIKTQDRTNLGDFVKKKIPTQLGEAFSLENSYLESDLFKLKYKENLQVDSSKEILLFKEDNYKTRIISEEESIGFKVFQIPNYNLNDSMPNNSLRTDGKSKTNKRSSIIQKEQVKFRNLNSLKDIIFNGVIVSKLSWVSLDDFGPYKILYSILDSIRGSKGLAVITGNVPVIEELSEIFLGEGLEMKNQDDETVCADDEILKVDKENVCLVSLVDGVINSGLAGLTATYFGQTYHFCSHECLSQFRWSPDEFVNALPSLEKFIPFNIFYAEPPSCLGKYISALLSYYFGTKLYFMDDFIVQRFARPEDRYQDLKSIALRNDLMLMLSGDDSTQFKCNEEVLWNYLIQKNGAPNLKYVIENMWKKGIHTCIYNFPYHQLNLKEAIKKNFLPNIMIKTALEILKENLGYYNCDFLYNYVINLNIDNQNVIRHYFNEFKWWVEIWRERFCRSMQILKRENRSNKIILAQKARLELKEKQAIPLLMITPNMNTNSESSSESLEKPTSEETKEKNDIKELTFNFLTDKKKKEGKNNNRIMKQHIFVERSEVECLPPFWTKSLKENKNSRIKLPSSRASSEINQGFFLLVDKDNHLLVTNENDKELSKLYEVLKSDLVHRLFNELIFRKKIKEDIDFKNRIEMDESNFTDDLLSVDSMGFEDYETIDITNKDLDKENCLKLMEISLKHTNTLNPMPLPLLNKSYDNFNPDDMYDFLTHHLNTYSMLGTQFEKCLEGIECCSFDITNNEAKDLIDQVKINKKNPLFSECVTEIDPKDVKKLLKTGFYFLSNFGFQCPVQSQSGFIYPHKTIMNDSSNCYPVAFGRYLYFLGSKNALENFKYKPLEYVSKAEYQPLIPLKVVFFGPVTKRLKKVINALAKEYSLEHISVGEVIEYYIKMAPWTKLGQRLKWSTSYVAGLPYPVKIPVYLIWQAVESRMISPKSTTHGFIISGVIPQFELFQAWKLNKFKPDIIFYTTVVDQDLFQEYQLYKLKENLLNIGRKHDNYEFILNFDLASSNVFVDNETYTWKRSMHTAYIKYLKKYYYNVYSFLYETSAFMMYNNTSSVILEVLRSFKLFLKADVNGENSPMPVGHFFSEEDYRKYGDYNWASSCPICICTTLRYDYKVSIINSVFFYEGKVYWICSKHQSVFLDSPKAYTSTEVLNVEHCTEFDANMKQADAAIFNGLCPVCYWLRKPYEEKLYRIGSSNYSCFQFLKEFKLCSKACYIEFLTSPWFYNFEDKFVDSRIKEAIYTSLNYPFDTLYWKASVIKNMTDTAILKKFSVSCFYFHLLRIATELDICYPGWTNQKARLFFVYALAKCHLAQKNSANRWALVLIDFLSQSGKFSRTFNKFLEVGGEYMPPALFEQFVANLDK